MMLVLSIFVTGCGDENSTSDNDDAPAGVSLSGDVLPLILESCGGCHKRMGAPFPNAVANEVYYEDEEDILGLVGSFIIAGDSANSGFVAILAQDLAVGQGPTLMPPPDRAEPMDESQVTLIKAWIDQGAKNN